jgi:assimilatory nitrate reductase catalytic subunit
MALRGDYWALARTEAGFRAELAGLREVSDWAAEARALFGAEEGDLSCVIDTARGTARVALERDGRLQGALFVARQPVAVMRDYLSALPGQAADGVLMGRAPADRPDPGPVVCSCFGVGLNTIVGAVEGQGLLSVEAIGAALQAGTNCGSCRPELAGLLARIAVPEAAE